MNDCTCITTVAIVLPTVSIQKALSLLPVSDKYECLPVIVSPGEEGALPRYG